MGSKDTRLVTRCSIKLKKDFEGYVKDSNFENLSAAIRSGMREKISNWKKNNDARRNQ